MKSSEASELTKQLKSSEKDGLLLSEQVDTLTKELSKQTTSVENLQAKLDDLNSLNIRTQSRVDALTEELEKCETSLNKAQSELSDSHKVCAKLEGQLMQYQQ